MKLKLLRWLLLAIVPAALMFGAASSAQATSYECDGPINPVPMNAPGTVEIEVTSGDCVIPHDVTAQGNITINVYSGKLTAEKLTSVDGRVFLFSNNEKIKTKKISAGTLVRIQTGVNGGSTASTIDVGDIVANTSNIQSGNANILLQAWGPISTKDIKTNGTLGPQSKRSGAVQIDAYMGGSSTLFLLGAASNNGINGSIDTRSTDGGGMQISRVESGVRITNGNQDSTGGITLSAMSNIKVKNSISRSGQIELNARKGVINLPAGELDASGVADRTAGFIYLMANKIVASDGTKIKANQSAAAGSVIHQVVIAAETIEFSGSSGLQITSDGNGVTPVQLSGVWIVPQGGLTSTSTGPVESLLWQRSLFEFFTLKAPVNFNGASGAPLTISANGNFTRVAISGYPINFTGGDLTIRARGSNDWHEVIMGYFDTGDLDGDKGLKFDNTGKVIVSTQALNNQTGNGGDIQIQTDVITLNALEHEFRASGPSSVSNGDGGTIVFTGNQVLLPRASKAKFNADASESGGGNAQMLRNQRKAIFFAHGSSNINIAKGEFSFSADSGQSFGNAGAIDIVASQGRATVQGSESAVSASALSPSGKGGEIALLSNEVKLTVIVDLPGDLRAIRAEGGVNDGAGGKVTITKAIGPNISTPINLDAMIKVDSGPNAPETGVFHGSITMNKSPIDDQPLTCQRLKNQTVAYPNSYWYCGTTPEKSGVVMNSIKGMPSSSLDELDTYNAPIFVFRLVEEYNAFLVDNKSVEGADYAFTVLLDDQHKIVVLEAQSFGPAIQYFGDDLVSFVARHEAGHILDIQFGSEVSRSFVSAIGGDQTTSYDIKVEKDYNNMLSIPSCGAGGMFEGRTHGGQPLCPLQGVHVGMNNRQILENLFPYYVVKHENGTQWRELWPEQVAKQTGPTGQRELEYYLQNFFPCSNQYVDTLVSSGVLAPASSYPSQCN